MAGTENVCLLDKRLSDPDIRPKPVWLVLTKIENRDINETEILRKENEKKHIRKVL